MAAQNAVVVYGRVLTDSLEVPIVDAAISLNNGAFGTITDSVGRYRLPAVLPGRYLVLVRKLGFAPVTATLQVGGSDSLNADFLLAALPHELPRVDVATTVIDRKLAGFQERRRLGTGRFLDEADLTKARGSRLSEKLRHLPGLVILYQRGSSNQVRVASTRGPQGFRAGPCLAAVMLDGIMVHDFSINSLQPEEVAAIEWYAGPSQMPAQFNATRNACGLLVLWTK